MRTTTTKPDAERSACNSARQFVLREFWTMKNGLGLVRCARARSVTKETFLAAVDAIRHSRKENVGWQLEDETGRVLTEREAFGQSVCYGVNESSFFNA